MDKLSKLFTIVLFLFVTVSIPVTTYLVQQETKTESEASFELPVSLINNAVQIADQTDTSVSTGVPVITLVWPFLGKVGDAVAIYGHNFGYDPANYLLFFGPTVISEENILQWSPEQICFLIPDLPVGQLAGQITVMAVGASSVWEKPFMIYDVSTEMQVMKPSTAIVTDNVPETFLIQVYLDDNSVISAYPEKTTEIPLGRSVVSLLVKNEQGVSQPFFVEPDDFDF